MSSLTAKSNFENYKASKTAVPFQDLEKLFHVLDPVSPTEIIGKWKGGYIKSGNLIDWTLKNYGIIKWVGKNFVTENKVKALMFSFLGLPFNFPIIGNARIREVKFQNKISTAMIYNHLPVIDHFRKIDNSTFMGAMDFKGKVVLYFYLCR